MTSRSLSLLAALLLCTSAPAGAQRPSPTPYPASLKAAITYAMTSSEDIGTENVPQCRSGGWNAKLDLALERKQASPSLVVYGVKSGTWAASGSCGGEMSFTMGDRACRWQMGGKSGGAGTFPSQASQGELTLYPRAKFFAFAFQLQAPGGYSYKWEPYCDRPSGAGTTDWSFHGDFTGSVSLEGGRLRLAARSDTSWTNDNVNGRYHSHTVASFYEKLRAVPGGPYALERARVVELDGSASEGRIDEYEWALRPGGNCPAGTAASVTLKGAKVSFKALCSLTATLTVTSGQERDSKPVAVTVNPRRWQTPFQHAGEGPMEAPAPLARKTLDPATGKFFWGVTLVGGENVSADEPNAPANALLYPLPTGDSWEDLAYTLENVTDEGPFKGLWYVGEYRARVTRKTLVNKYLLEDGPTILRMSLYKENKRRGTRIDDYLQAIRDHEGMGSRGVLGHSGLIERALRADDPASSLESAIESGRDALKRRADDALRAANLRMCKATRDPLPVTWRGVVAFPMDDASGWITGPAIVGGPNPEYDQMRKCT